MALAVLKLLAPGLLATIATAQTIPDAGIVIFVDTPVLMPGESTSVTLAAAWPTQYAMMASVFGDLLSSEGMLGLSEHTLVAPMDGPGTRAGVLTAAGIEGIEGIMAGQLNFPPGGHHFQPNPLPFWQATYTAPMDVASPFSIEFSTRTTRFDVYPDAWSADTLSILDQVIEAHTTIRVIPAPAGVLVLGMGLLALSCRRRCG